MTEKRIQNQFDRHPLAMATRRQFLQSGTLGLGSLALADLGIGRASAGETKEAPGPLVPKTPHFPGKAKNVIYLHMAGSPPHLDLFDYKPTLESRTGEDCPAEFYEGKQFAFTSNRPTLLGTPHKFQQHGESLSLIHI